MRPTEPFRKEHEQLLEHIEHIAQAAREMPRLSDDERSLLRERVLDFLRDTLIPHARAEERLLYPEWAKLVGYPDAAAPMIHEAALRLAKGLRPSRNRMGAHEFVADAGSGGPSCSSRDDRSDHTIATVKRRKSQPCQPHEGVHRSDDIRADGLPRGLQK